MFSETKSLNQKTQIIKDSFKNLAVSALQSIWVTHNTRERVYQLIEEEPGIQWETIEDIWPDYPTKEDFIFNEDEY